LEPAESKHAKDLANHASPETFRFFPTLQPATYDQVGLKNFIQQANQIPNMIPFAQVIQNSGEAVGMTSYLDIRQENRGVEIGFTWLGQTHQGTRINPEAKILLLQHAFEECGCIRVQLKTDARNLQSRAAISKLGAVFEGILRHHVVMPDGYLRDTAMYSILASEWPEIRERLRHRLGY
jgi:RimJ/RimL family protein N-acetyltransferase